MKLYNSQIMDKKVNIIKITYSFFLLVITMCSYADQKSADTQLRPKLARTKATDRDADANSCQKADTQLRPKLARTKATDRDADANSYQKADTQLRPKLARTKATDINTDANSYQKADTQLRPKLARTKATDRDADATSYQKADTQLRPKLARTKATDRDADATSYQKADTQLRSKFARTKTINMPGETAKHPVKKALIFGVTGQDGAYLSELLLSMGYEVHGVKRRASLLNTARIDHLYEDCHVRENNRFVLHYGDVTDSSNIIRLMQEIKPDEVYNLSAQSHVQVSFELPEYTAQVDALGTLRILEAIKIVGLAGTTKFYQASTSELYGQVQEIPQKETTPFYPRSPYAVAKIYGYWITKNYRQAYNMFACNGILFNHESPIRGETFVTRKITRAVARIHFGLQDILYLGNLNAQRDWGHARDYVYAMWLMLQQDTPDDYVISTGTMYSVRDFVEKSFAHVGVEIVWEGTGIDEVGYNKATGLPIVCVDKKYFRPTEVELLIGDSTKARQELGWEPKINFSQLVAEMMQAELAKVKQQIAVLNG